MFKYWLSLNENIEDNFEKWFTILVRYATKNIEKDILNNISRILPGRSNVFFVLAGKDPDTFSQKDKDYLYAHRDFLEDLLKKPFVQIIKNVLKEKNLENYNWFAFSIGYLSSKPNFFVEDLELAIDVTKRRIDSRELPKSEIGKNGWLVIGSEAQEKVEEYLASQVSNRSREKMRKRGETLGDDEKYIRLLLNENGIKVYICPSLGSDFSRVNLSISRGTAGRDSSSKEKILKDRQSILCKYGKDTQWCTANPSGTFHEYYAENNIYIVHRNDKPIYQFVDCKDPGSHQFMDVKDHSVKELEKDVYEILNKYLEENIKCYDITRAWSLQELLEADDAGEFEAYQRISLNNIRLLIEESDTKQAIYILRNIIKHRDKKWLEYKGGYVDYAKELVLDAFVNKIGVEKLVEILGDYTSNLVIRKILLPAVRDPSKETSLKVYEIIKKLLSINSNIFKNNSLDQGLTTSIIRKISKVSKEKTEEVIDLLGPKSINGLQESDILSLIDTAGFDIIYKIFDNRTNKIESKLVGFLISKLKSYAQNIDKIDKGKTFIRKGSKLVKSPSIIRRSGLPTKGSTKAREMQFVRYLLDKDISTGAIEMLLAGDYLQAKTPEEKIEKIKEIAEMIGTERITKIKNKSIPEIIQKAVGGFVRQKAQAILANPNQQYVDLISLEKEDEDVQKLRDFMNKILQQYHQKLGKN